MARRWSGVLVVEGIESGDGRIIADGALDWEVPFSLEWNPDDQASHEGIVVVGMVESATRMAGGLIKATGTIDDGQEAGVEVIRLMGLDPPLASGVSIVMDDMEIQVLVDGEEELSLIASGRMVFGAGRTLFAAAGDPDPGDPGDGETDDGKVVLFEDSMDSMLQRVTRARIRAATLVDVPAFIEARITLDPVEEGETSADSPPLAVVASPPVRPPSSWFSVPEPEIGDERLVEQRNGRLACPLTILDCGQVYGHAAVEGSPHIGYPGELVTPPTSAGAYREFHLGHVVCDDDVDIPTGVLVAGCDHAAITLRAPGARDYYAHNGVGWADVRFTDGVFGPWFCGALRPDVTDVQIRALRGGSLSGDWRDFGDGDLEFIAGLAVNTPGFPVYRETVAASAWLRPAARAAVHMVDGHRTALVAAGIVHRCADCADKARVAALGIRPVDDEVLRCLRALELRTRHLVPAAVAHAAGRIRR